MEIPQAARTQVNKYIRDNFISIPDVVNKYESIAKNKPIPPHHISPELGKLLSILIFSIKAKNILEIGTMWGYSTWWMYQGLPKDGNIITLDKEHKHFNLANKFFEEANIKNIDSRRVDALQELKTFKPNQFDFIFLDADKKEYPQFYYLIKDLVKPGGMLVVDNVIFSSAWKNKTVAEETNNKSIISTQKFNQLIAQDKSFTAIPVATNSGILIAYKK